LKKTVCEHLTKKQKRAITKTSFLDEYCNAVFDTCTLRQRVPADMPLQSSYAHVVDDTVQALQTAKVQHKLICPQDEKAKAESATAQSFANKKKYRLNGFCVICHGADPKGKKHYTKYKCLACPRGQQWYHVECYFTIQRHQQFVATRAAANKRKIASPEARALPSV
jgi:hypothetical protein